MKNYLKKISLVLLLCLLTLPGWAQFEGYRLSPDARISLITCSSGDELYAIFGHSAVRVQDPATGMDIAFNYGTFDFDEPNFYLKFIQGKLRYMLSAAHFSDFVYSYSMDNRSVYEQVLNLDEAQRQQYWAFLTHNYQPANRFYLYDFFFDNCATRIRDGLEAAFPNQVAFKISHLDKHMSFRNLIDLYLVPQPWSDFGIDLALGARIDRQASPYEYMFLPDYLSKGFANATILQDGRAVPLAGEPQVIFERAPVPFSVAAVTPVLVWWLLLGVVVILTALDLAKGRRSRVFDMVFFFFTGVLGLVLLLLWVATDHQATANNYNLLWAIPTHMVVAVLLRRHALPDWASKYMRFTGLVTGIAVLGWWLWPQQLHPATLPIAISLITRALYAVWFSRKVKSTAPAHSSIKEKI